MEDLQKHYTNKTEIDIMFNLLEQYCDFEITEFLENSAGYFLFEKKCIDIDYLKNYLNYLKDYVQFINYINTNLPFDKIEII